MVVLRSQAIDIGVRMNKTQTQPGSIGRRAELLAELFLQDLKPEFVARPTADFGYDFFAGFRNPRGGINVIAVEVKSTEHLTKDFISLKKSTYDTLANSNIPVLLLVVDVKENDYYFAWPDPDVSNQQKAGMMKVQLTKVNDKLRKELRDRLAA